jgi:hypothetical protein
MGTEEDGCSGALGGLHGVGNYMTTFMAFVPLWRYPCRGLLMAFCTWHGAVLGKGDVLSGMGGGLPVLQRGGVPVLGEGDGVPVLGELRTSHAAGRERERER